MSFENFQLPNQGAATLNDASDVFRAELQRSPFLQQMSTPYAPAKDQVAATDDTNPWLNPALDIALGAAGLFATTVATRNPMLGLKMLEETPFETKLVVGLTSTFGPTAGGVLGRHYLYESLTGKNESWGDSFGHYLGGYAVASGARFAAQGLKAIEIAKFIPKELNTSELAKFFQKA